MKHHVTYAKSLLRICLLCEFVFFWCLIFFILFQMWNLLFGRVDGVSSGGRVLTQDHRCSTTSCTQYLLFKQPLILKVLSNEKKRWVEGGINFIGLISGASTKRPLLRTSLPYIIVLVCIIPCIIYSWTKYSFWGNGSGFHSVYNLPKHNAPVFFFPDV